MSATNRRRAIVVLPYEAVVLPLRRPVAVPTMTVAEEAHPTVVRRLKVEWNVR